MSRYALLRITLAFVVCGVLAASYRSSPFVLGIAQEPKVPATNMAETRAAHMLAVKTPTKQTSAPQRPTSKGFAAQTASCGVRAPGGGARWLVAVCWSGLKRRLLLDSMLQRLIAPLVAEGSAVHVYESLLHNDSGVGMWKHVRKRTREDPALASVGAGELGAYLKGRIASTGACLAYGEVLRRPEDLGSLPERPRDLKKYPPWSTQTGKRLLRLWKARERLWNATQASEVSMRRVYDLLLWVRDDSLWGVPSFRARRCSSARPLPRDSSGPGRADLLAASTTRWW